MLNSYIHHFVLSSSHFKEGLLKNYEVLLNRSISASRAKALWGYKCREWVGLFSCSLRLIIQLYGPYFTSTDGDFYPNEELVPHPLTLLGAFWFLFSSTLAGENGIKLIGVRLVWIVVFILFLFSHTCRSSGPKKEHYGHCSCTTVVK